MTLPDFYCIGAQKAGTTWLYDCMRSHPQVHLPEYKEVNYFRRWQGEPSTYEKDGIGGYEELYRDAGSRTCGDISPGLLAADCAPLLRDLTPDARILAIVRDPADRAYSHYRMLDGRHRLPHRFDELVREPDRADPHQILFDGLYGRHLAPFVDSFGLSRVRVLRFEALRESPEDFYATICRFVGVDANHRPDALRTRSNVAGRFRFKSLYAASVRVAQSLAGGPFDGVRRAIKRSGLPALIRRLNRVEEAAPPLDPALRASLIEYYRSDIEQLAALVPGDYAAWLR